MKKVVVFTAFVFILSCTSKNRFDGKNPDSLKTDPIENSKMNPIKGHVEDVESDAIPFLKVVADSPRWSANFGLIGEDLFDVKIDMNGDNKIYFGILKRVRTEGNPGEFFGGELTNNNIKYPFQFYIERLPCVDNSNKQHGVRVSMLKDKKEYYACGDLLNGKR